MNSVNLRSIDLNLLTVFSAIYEYRNLTRAADALGMTQPAVSHALKRLRSLFGDPLFLRIKGRMEPTPRSHAAAGPVAEILTNVTQVLNPGATFEPALVRREIRIGLLDYGMTVFAPRIAEFVMAEAPSVKIDFRHTESGRAARQMEDADIDLYIGPGIAAPDIYRRSPLTRSDAVVVARRGHPAVSVPLSLSGYCALDHVRFTNLSTIDREIDAVLERENRTRRTVIKVPHYSSALFVVSRSDLVTTITRGPAALYRDFLELDLLETPFTLSSSEISILRHPRTDNDPLIVWLWDRIRTFGDLQTDI